MNEIIPIVFQNIEGFLIAMARAFGFSIMFTPFSWAGIDSGTLRMVFVLAISLPIVLLNLSNPGSVEDIAVFTMLIILSKELVLGMILGWLVSKPFEIAVFAGGYIDSYRNGMSGDTDPAGGRITIYSKLFFVAAIFQFIAVGGYWLIADVLYKSYQFWPLGKFLPAGPISDIGIIVEMVGIILASAAVIAGPIVFSMIISDLFFLFSAKFGKNINTFHLAFSVKSTLALCLLPLNILVFNRIFDDYILSVYDTLEEVKNLF